MLKNKKGFTLVELLAVIVILAIILAIAIPGISGIITSAKKSAFESDARMIVTAIQYKTVESSIDSTVTAPAVHAAAITSATTPTITTELAKYGINAANYSSFQITDLDPITIKITSTAASKFGSFTATVSKSSITYP